MNSLLSTDIFEIDTIHNLKGMRLVFDLLRSRVGSPVSYQSLAEDVGISPMTVKRYIQILEAIFVIFVVTPYTRNIARSLLKEPKIYFFDTALVQGDEGAILENLVDVKTGLNMKALLEKTRDFERALMDPNINLIQGLIRGDSSQILEGEHLLLQGDPDKTTARLYMALIGLQSYATCTTKCTEGAAQGKRY